jgi:hypothetical protein
MAPFTGHAVEMSDETAIVAFCRHVHRSATTTDSERACNPGTPDEMRLSW